MGDTMKVDQCKTRLPAVSPQMATPICRLRLVLGEAEQTSTLKKQIPHICCRRYCLLLVLVLVPVLVLVLVLVLVKMLVLMLPSVNGATSSIALRGPHARGYSLGLRLRLRSRPRCPPCYKDMYQLAATPPSPLPPFCFQPNLAHMIFQKARSAS